MARNRTVDLLPEIFKTDTNKEFLSSTLDQLTQQPKLKQIQGYVGRKFGVGIDNGDSYVIEPTAERSNYQLEPGIVFNDDEGNVDSAITYPEIIDALKTKGADISRHDRLFSSPIYSWSPLIDFDKFVNHSQYYWLPSGPDSVDVSSTDILLTDNFDISRNDNSYSLSGISGTNPTITLARGGEYTFSVNQPGHNFFIQTETGISGTLSHSPNISSRDVYGVLNNGEDGGTVTFAVPEVTNQQFYYDLTKIDAIDLATFSRFDAINGMLLSNLKNIDGIVDLEGKTIVFLDTTAGNSADLGWQYLDLHEDAPFEAEPFEETTFIDSQVDRYSVYQIAYTTSNNETVIKLNKIKAVANLEKFDIIYGSTYSNKSFYKNSVGFFQEIPLLTATHDVLYYQDATDADKFGIINLVDSVSAIILNVDTDIVGKKNYTSANGVDFTNGLKVIFRGNVNPSSYQDKEYYVEGVGDAIKLIASVDLITPEVFTTSVTEPFDYNTFDSTNFDGNLNSPTKLDFITINRASNDLNPWSRSNRWVHKDVITKTAEYNNAVAIFNNDFRASRPIIEFHANTKLFNFGTASKTPITSIDFNEDDALSNINGSTGFAIDGVAISDGARVVFANDSDDNVRNKIYDVSFVDLEGNGVLNVELTPSEDTTVAINDTVVVKVGHTTQGKTYHFDGINWKESQQKTSVNQPPLFDVYDSNGLSLSDTSMYKSSTFSGTKMFSYGVGTGNNDKVLGFPLSFLNIDNLGDIVFKNDLHIDTFTYGTTPSTKKVSDGYIRKYSSRTTYNNENGWTKRIDNFMSEQVFDFDYDGVSLVIDVVPKTGLNTPPIKVYINNKFINSSNYTVTTELSKTVIVLADTVTVGSEVNVSVISDTASANAYYKVPKNLENNPFNENSDTLTLGTIRNHYTNLAQNLLELNGEISGANNSRDLKNIEQYGDTIIQNSSPIVPMAKFLHSKEFNFFDALEFNANAYEKFKLKILDYVAKNDTYGLTPSVVLDNALESINVGKSPSSPFYKSDMLGGSCTPTITTHTVTPISTSTFNIINIYDFTKANNSAILVYLNNAILVKGRDYTVASDAPNINILVSLKNDDVITVKEFETTIGSYVPNTPTKLGLYPKFQPKKYLDDTYTTSTNVVQGHDGSITVAFDDARDDVLLEFEKRIYNNIKIDSKIPIRDVDVIPGKFRDTDYTDAETTNILSNSFLNWVGWNRLDYKTQDYSSNNELSWNYSTSSSKLDDSALKGHWRGIYKNYYDTDTPHTTPWEMLGITKKPSWWEDAYGIAPYTSGNLVLWDDLESGLIKDPSNNRIDVRYKRDGLTKVIPVDSEGKLLNPFVSIVKNYSQSDFRKSWVIGDCGPTENAWRRSSSYPFALQRLFALTKPAQYFALSIDRDRYAFDSTMNQYLYDSRYRLDARTIDIQTSTKPKHSYINWLADYHNNNGCSCLDIATQLSKVDVRLCYRMASFTDKNYLKIFTDKSSPDSSNNGLLLPDQSYDLILHKNQPLSELQYSSVIVQKTDDGYSVYGHGNSQQYFEILQSTKNNTNNIQNGVSLPNGFTNNVTLVPYGYVFTNKDAIVDFLVSYGAFLESRGMVFGTTENTNTLDWGMMAQEFLKWASQGWGTGSIVNLNPGAISLEFNKELSIVDNIHANNTQVLDQNGVMMSPNDYTITRLDNNFKITSIGNNTINFLSIRSTSYEHLLVIDNVSIFNDLLYKPVNGLRQHRVRLVGFTTFDWNGQLDAQGFILNQDNVDEWKENTFYTIGNIVKFKNTYWSAVSKLQPSTTFNFTEWTKINYSDIKKGLLPNISNKASQITEYYNKNTTNLESDVSLLAMGLVGFRPRSYLDSLDDISQVNFYNGFISSKGTSNSTSAFRNVKFDKKVTDYEIFENWAIRDATFGNSDNTAFVDFELDNSKLQNNPSIIEVVSNNNITTKTHQLIKVEDVYNQSVTHTTNNIFPIRTSELTDTNLPIAGHVRTSDVDIALYEISDLNGAAGIPFMAKLSSGTTIWVAKDTPHDWNVYRTDIHSNISSILPVDGVIEVTFFHNHDFVTHDRMIIQDISILVNGAYTVEKVIDSKVIRLVGTIDDAFVNIASDSSLTADSDLYKADHKLGFVYKLTSIRVESKINLTDDYNDTLPIGARVWVNRNENNKHAVYQKYDVIGNILSDNALVTSDNDIITADGDGAWAMLHEEQDAVDVTLINKALLFDKDTNQVIQNLDYIDPLNGKILGIADENINYSTPTDPASYNQGTNIGGTVWGEDHVGKIWWDTSNARFLDYNQSDISYSSNNWGNLFPGSTIDIRQWVKSTIHPSQYKGDGTVVDLNSFTTVSSIDNSNTIVQCYYFWITDSITIDVSKSLSINAIKQYIEAPFTSGISFIAFINNSTVGIYNSQQFISNSIMHISYKHTNSEGDVFNEYSLIKENNKNDFLNDSNYKKLQDSFVGGNKIGLSVPDYKLNDVQKNGIGFRPRQSMFKNRFGALEEYLTQVNAILKKHIISTNTKFELLNSEEAIPKVSSNTWDLQIQDLAELNYQNLDIVAIGYKYLVTTDTDNNGGWSIYEVIDGPKLQLIRVQEYNTTRAWSYIDWYEDTDAETAIAQEVISDSSKLTSLSLPNKSYVNVTSNSNGKFEIYQLRDGYWVRVGLEDGTIAFNESLWSGTSTQDSITVDSSTFTVDSIINSADRGTGGNELRNIIRAINESILDGELLLERNKLLVSIFNYILAEQDDVNWLYKTSLIDVEHKVRDLEQYNTYKKDDQDFLLKYITESKPYHTKIKEFLLKYNGTDQYNTDIADFDIPTYYDESFDKFINPILDYDGVVLKSDQSNFDDDGVGMVDPNYNIWELSPWDSWYNNRALSIKSATIVNAGINYTQIPTVTVSGGGATTQATMSARINNSGQIIAIVVSTEGIGYTATPVITISGNGNGAIVTPVMQNSLVRNLNTTIKYDRCEYTATVVDWVSNTTLSTTTDTNTLSADNNTSALTVDSYDTVYDADQLVRYNNKVYTHNVTRAFKTKFSLDDFTIVDSSTLTASDRTMGYYTPNTNDIGLNLSALIHGIDYPGVIVKDLDFNNSAGFSVLPFDVDPYDVIEVDDDGSTSYSDGVLDTEYSSSFNDLYLGTRPEDINADGGGFVDTYSSHSPEELIPGSMFDTLDLSVHTRPGFDYQGNGHAFEIQYVLHEYQHSSPTLSFDNVVAHPITIKVVNTSTRTSIHMDEDYTVNWVNKTITVTNAAFDGDNIQIFVYEIGGGNQLFRNTYVGSEVLNSLTIPVESQSIYDIVILVNGTQLKDGFTSSSDGSITVDSILETADSSTITVDKVSLVNSTNTTISFTDTYSGTDFISVTVFGFETTQHNYTYPIVTHFSPYGADTTEYTADTALLTADNVSSDYDLSVVYLDDKNKQNAIVEHNGKRLRPPEAKRYAGDGVVTDFRLPTVGGVDHTLVSNSEIVVFNGWIKQTLSTDYTVITVVVGAVTYKEVRFTTAPATNAVVDVYVNTISDYTIDSSSVLRVKPHITIAGIDELDVTTWNDTEEIDLLTSSFKGPTTTTTPVIDLFDASDFDSVGFDFVGTSSADINLFDLGRTIVVGYRLWVTLNGNVLLDGVDYSVSGTQLLLAGELIGPTDIVTVTSMTGNIVPDALAFKIFKDMNGNSAMYKINTCCLKKVNLASDLNITDDTIYLNDVSNLTVPNLTLGTFGILTIDGERITYRNVDNGANTISGLRRGTAGTGITKHTKETVVHDVSITNIVTNSVITSTTLGADTDTASTAHDNIWYASGASTVSNGIALQNQTTAQANFVKTR